MREKAVDVLSPKKREGRGRKGKRVDMGRSIGGRGEKRRGEKVHAVYSLPDMPSDCPSPTLHSYEISFPFSVFTP